MASIIHDLCQLGELVLLTAGVGEEGECMAVDCWRGLGKGVHGCWLLAWVRKGSAWLLAVGVG